MQSKRMTTLVMGLVLVAGVMTAVAPVQAQNDQYMELMRQDLRTEKTALLTVGMNLTSEQGEVFWPIVRDYQNELTKIGDKRIAMIKAYAENYETMTGDKAAKMTKEWFSQQKDRLKLLEKTAKKVAKEVDPVIAARFIQVENSLNMIIDLQVASELPLFVEGDAPVAEEK